MPKYSSMTDYNVCLETAFVALYIKPCFRPVKTFFRQKYTLKCLVTLLCFNVHVTALPKRQAAFRQRSYSTYCNNYNMSLLVFLGIKPVESNSMTAKSYNKALRGFGRQAVCYYICLELSVTRIL